MTDPEFKEMLAIILARLEQISAMLDGPGGENDNIF